MYGRGEVEVGVPVGHVAPVCERLVFPTTRGPPHLNCIVSDQMKEGDAAGFPIHRKPRRRVPQEEGVRHSLLARGVNLLSHAGGRWSGGSVEEVHGIRFQDGCIVAAKRVSLGTGIIRTVHANRRRQIRLDDEAGHGGGA